MDVWAPAFTFPTKGVKLASGHTYNFTWYVSRWKCTSPSG
jgi:hypothetical protein